MRQQVNGLAQLDWFREMRLTMLYLNFLLFTPGVRLLPSLQQVSNHDTGPPLDEENLQYGTFLDCLQRYCQAQVQVHSRPETDIIFTSHQAPNFSRVPNDFGCLTPMFSLRAHKRGSSSFLFQSIQFKLEGFVGSALHQSLTKLWQIDFDKLPYIITTNYRIKFWFKAQILKIFKKSRFSSKIKTKQNILGLP